LSLLLLLPRQSCLLERCQLLALKVAEQLLVVSPPALSPLQHAILLLLLLLAQLHHHPLALTRLLQVMLAMLVAKVSLLGQPTPAGSPALLLLPHCCLQQLLSQVQLWLRLHLRLQLLSLARHCLKQLLAHVQL
jgi:hypothetical protein